MKLTLKNIKELKQNTSSALEKRACKYVIDEWSSYSDKKGIFTDVLHYGCVSGMVGFLIYYSDTIPFYKKHQDEINEMLHEFMWEIGSYNPKDVFGKNWDEEDPLCIETHNQNLMAWYGFEEALRKVGRNFEVLEDCI